MPRTSRTLWMRSCGGVERRVSSPCLRVPKLGWARKRRSRPTSAGLLHARTNLTSKLQILQPQTLHPLPLDRIDLSPPIAQPKPSRAPPPRRPAHQILLLLLIDLDSLLLRRFPPLDRLPFVVEHFEHLERRIGDLVYCCDLYEHGIFASGVEERWLERVGLGRESVSWRGGSEGRVGEGGCE
jgi:hypothetical protein